LYTLGSAAKATGRTKSAISKAIKKGRISAKKDELGRFEIDPAELHRIYAPLPAPEKGERERTLEITTENRELKARLEGLNQLLAEIRDDRDHWRRQATGLLTSQQEARATRRPWWWIFKPKR
jgi:hypothetical protein